MSSISDEIRNWCEFEDGTECGDFVTKASFDKLCALADRIDAEMVELPRDADGVPINLGDEVCLNGKNGRVTRIEYRIDEESYVIFWANRECIVCTKTELAELTHARPDSFERIADELEEWSEDNRVNGDSEVFDRASIFADRIRKLAKREDER